MNRDACIYEAVDTTNLQSAWAAIDPTYYGSTEIQCDRAFVEVVNRFIYAKRRIVPIPAGRIGFGNPLLQLWCSAEGSEDVVSKIGEPAEFEGTRGELLFRSFEHYAESFPVQLASWLGFQFTEAVTREYTSRMVPTGRHAFDAIALVVPEVERAVRENRLRRVREALTDSLQRISYPWFHQDAINMLRLQPVVYALCYAASHHLRGRNYAENLSRLATFYTPHWTRFSATFVHGLDLQNEQLDVERQEIDFGSFILQWIKAGHLMCPQDHIEDLLVKIRTAIQSGEFSERLRSDDPDDNLFAKVTILERAGIHLERRETPSYVTYAECVKSVAEVFLGQRLSTLFKAITIGLRSSTVQALDAKINRILLFDRYKRTYRTEQIERL